MNCYLGIKAPSHDQWYFTKGLALNLTQHVTCLEEGIASTALRAMARKAFAEEAPVVRWVETHRLHEVGRWSSLLLELIQTNTLWIVIYFPSTKFCSKNKKWGFSRIFAGMNPQCLFSIVPTLVPDKFWLLRRVHLHRPSTPKSQRHKERLAENIQQKARAEPSNQGGKLKTA